MKYKPDVGIADKFGKKIYERAKTEEIASMIRAGQSSRNLSAKSSRSVNCRKPVPSTPTHKCANNRSAINAHPIMRKSDIINTANTKLDLELKEKMRRESSLLNEFVTDNLTNTYDQLFNETLKSAGVKASNRRKANLSSTEKNTRNTNSILNTTARNSKPQTPRSTKPISESSSQSTEEAKEFIEEKIDKEIYDSLLKRMNERVDTAIVSLREEILATNRNSFNKLEREIKASLSNLANKKGDTSARKMTKSQKALADIGKKLTAKQPLKILQGSRNTGISKPELQFAEPAGKTVNSASRVEILHPVPSNFNIYYSVSDASRGKSKSTNTKGLSERRLKTLGPCRENAVQASPRFSIEEPRCFSKAANCIVERSSDKSNTPKLAITKQLSQYETS